MKLAYVIIISVVVFGGVFWYISSPKSFTVAIPNILTGDVSKSRTRVDSSSFQPIVKKAGAVDVEATLMQVVPENAIRIKLTLDTHSVNLDFDYARIAKLTDESGRMYTFREWTGERGGHHVSGELVFEPLSSRPKELALTLTDIEGESLEYKWILTK